MKSFFLAIALLIALPANAQHGPSSYLDGWRGYNPGSLGGPATSKSFVCSFWYSIDPGEARSAVLVDTSGYLQVSAMIALTHDIGSNTYHLAIVTGDFAGNHTWSMLSEKPVPIDGQWHVISFAVSTSLHLAVMSVDGNSSLLEDIHGADPGPFEIPVNGNRWTIGSAMGPRPILPSLFYDGRFVGVSIAQYKGALDQLTCKFKDSAYIDILTPNRGLGFVQSVYDQTGTRLIFRPLELGPYCSMPWGGDPAELCMRGSPEFFKLNNSGSTSFTTIEGALVRFIDSPFSKWWE